MALRVINPEFCGRVETLWVGAYRSQIVGVVDGGGGDGDGDEVSDKSRRYQGEGDMVCIGSVIINSDGMSPRLKLWCGQSSDSFSVVDDEIHETGG